MFPRPDVLITWPSGCDYPLFRYQIKLFRRWFNKVIVCFYEHGKPDFTPWLRLNFGEAVFTESAETGNAWRERAVEKALKLSTSPFLLFSEQDFFWKDDRFLKLTFSAAQNFDTVGIKNEPRLHPCYLLTKRETLEKTSKDFGVQGYGKDHFSKVTAELLKVGTFKDLKELSLYPISHYYHFSSLTWNLFRIKDQNIREMHEIENFLLYNYYSRIVPVPQNKKWIAFSYYVENLLTNYGRFLNG